MKEYINKIIKDGYIDGETLAPIKCQYCEGKDHLRGVNHIFENFMMVEYEVMCTECNKIVGHWSYGYWQVY